MENQPQYKNYVFDFLGAVSLFVGLIFGVCFVGVYTLVEIYLFKSNPNDLFSSMLFMFVSYIATLIFPILAYDLIVVRGKGQRLNFNMKSPKFGTYLLVFPLMFGMMLISEFVTELIPIEGEFFGDMYEQLSNTLSTMAQDNVGIIILTSFFAPLLEEIIFRGIIQKGMINGGMKPAKAILLSAFIFGAFHLNPWQFAGAFLIGIVLGLVYYKTQSLLMPILLHAFNNFINSLLLINGKTESFGDLFHLPEHIILLIGIVIFSVFYYLFEKYNVKTTKYEV